MPRCLKYIVLIAAFLAVQAVSQAAPPYRDADFSRRLDDARDLYYRHSYAAAEQAFADLALSLEGRSSLVRSEVEAFRVMCSISMGRINAEWALDVFSSEYPNAPELPMVKYALASRYFEKGEYVKAQAILKQIDKRCLYRGWRTEFEFRRSFCNMRAGALEDASRGFETIIAGGRTPYTYPSLFYLGYVKYISKDFDGARKMFLRSAEDAEFSIRSSYYVLECNYMLRNYKEVTESGGAVFNSVSNDLKPKVARILSESFYALGDRQSASKYLDFFRKSSRTFTRNELYFSGALSYSMKNYRDALISLRQITSVQDSISQNAWYLMAGCHLGVHNQIAALNDFRMASEMDFDAAVKEKALFNYAKLSFDVNSDFSRFEEYMKAYPKSGRDDEISNYIAASSLLSKDYASAVTALKKISKQTPESKANLRKASFLRGMQQIEDGAYGPALKMLSLSRATVPEDDALGCLTDYWIAECLYRGGKYADAIPVFEGLCGKTAFAGSPEATLLPYNLAYCYFQNGDYASARDGFSDYVSDADGLQMRRDALLRLADIWHLEGNYATAASLFEDVYKEYPTDNDLYPVIHGAGDWALAGENGRRINLLSLAVQGNRNSEMYPQALYELGRAYSDGGRSADALECFLTLSGMGTDSTYCAKALLAMAGIYSASGRRDKAISCCKKVVEDCRGMVEVDEALTVLDSLYRSADRPVEYLAYIDRLGLSGIRSGAEREKMLGLSVERLCRAGKYGSAISSAQSFLSEYPDGEWAPAVEFCLAESLSATGRKEAAIKWYRKAAADGDASLSVKASLAYASLSLLMGDYEAAMKTYGSALASTNDSESRTEALIGRIKAGFALKRYDNVITDAQNIFSEGTADGKTIRQARYYLARSYLKKEEPDYARTVLSSLASDTSDAIGAEAAYLLISDAFNAGRFEDVETRVSTFSASGTPEKYWLARSFIILGDARLAKGDTVGAESSYRSVLDTYTDTDDDIRDRVLERLSNLNSNKSEGLR